MYMLNTNIYIQKCTKSNLRLDVEKPISTKYIVPSQ